MTRLSLDLSRSIARSKSCTRFGLFIRPMPRLALPLCLAIFALVGASLPAQNADRVRQEVGTPRMRALPNHHPRWANAANDAGSLPKDKLLNQLTVVLSRSPEQQLAFESFLADQQNPTSPEYHHWLTPTEIGDRFGLSAQDVASVTTWLQSQGLHINWISPSRIFIGFGGTAADLSRALQTELHYYAVNGMQRFSVSSDPMIPEALAPAFKAIHGLYSIEERPLHRAESMQSDSPLMTASGGVHFIAPADFATIYDVPDSWSGAGQSIGILGRSRTNSADFENFGARTGTYFANPTEIVPSAFGGVDPGPARTSPPGSGVDIRNQGEATLDVMRAGSVAPSANLLLVAASEDSGGIEVDAQYLVQTSPVPVQVMTISFGACESSVGPSGVALWDSLFQQAAAEGISSVVSSGDSGASGCDDSFQTPPASPQPNSPNYICSSSYATCAGGTEFNDAGNPSTYWSSVSGNSLSSALGYIPEGAWNEPIDSLLSPEAASSGGGVSSVIATPSWQTGAGVPADRTGRYTPDISFSASEHDGYFGCFAAGGGSCVVAANGSYGFVGFAGTSAAAPSMAGIAALLNQAKAEPQGNLNPELYKLAAVAPAAFHDVKVTSSGVLGCDIAIPSMCNNSIPSAYGLMEGQPGYLVTAGYDEVTGLGSLDVQTLIGEYTAKLTPIVTLAPSATTIDPAQPLTVAVTVNGGSGNPTPTGSVMLTSGKYASAAVIVNNGGATIQIPGGSLAMGVDSLAVYYTPDTASSTTYGDSSALASVTVNLVAPTVTVTLSSSNISTAQPLTVTVAVSGPANSPTPTGTVDLVGTGIPAGTTTLTLAGRSVTFNFVPGMLLSGTDTLTGEYNPDANGSLEYIGATGSSSVTVTATAEFTPTVTVTPPSPVVRNTIPLPIAVSVGGVSGNPAPTGSVTLISGSYSSPPAPLLNGCALIAIPAGTLPIGSDNLIAIYAPDSASSATYDYTSGSAWVYNSQSVLEAPVIEFVSSSQIITTEALSVVVYVYGATGTVTLSSGSYSSPAATLVNNMVTTVIPAGALPVGADILTALYTPDAASSSIYAPGSGSETITVFPPPTPGFIITSTDGLLSPGATSGNTSTIRVWPLGGFAGAVALSAVIATSPAGAQDPPSLSFGSTSPVNITDANPETATLTITTKAPTTSALIHSQHPGVPWFAAGGAALACVFFFAFPKRRRWHTILGAFALFAALSVGVLACGGVGGITGGGGSGNSGTTTGAYTITVTGISGTTTATGTVTVNVQ